MVCGGSTSASDPALATAEMELNQMETALDKADKMMINTMTVFNDMIGALDRGGQAYMGFSGVCTAHTKQRLQEFEAEMRRVQERGLYAAFNSDVTSLSVNPFNPVRSDVATAKKALESVKKAFAEYETRRTGVEAKEAEFARKHQQVGSNPEYQKKVRERNEKKAVYEREKAKFQTLMERLRTKVNDTVVKASVSYANCASAYFDYMRKVLGSFTNADHPPKMSAMLSSYAPAARASPARTASPAAHAPAH